MDHFPDTKCSVFLEVTGADTQNGEPKAEFSAGQALPRYLPRKDAKSGTRGVAGEWEAIYLPQKHGLSGGWRGFALAQELEAGDVVVFERVTPTRCAVRLKHLPLTVDCYFLHAVFDLFVHCFLQVHMCRAFDQPSAKYNYDLS